MTTVMRMISVKKPKKGFMIWKTYVFLLTVTLEAKMWIRLYVSRTMIPELQLLPLELSLQLVPLSLPSNFASIAMQKV